MKSPFIGFFVISEVHSSINVVFDKIKHILVSEILTLRVINLQALLDSGDEFWNKSENCTVRTCRDHAEQKIIGFLCHISSKTGQKDLGFSVWNQQSLKFVIRWFRSLASSADIWNVKNGHFIRSRCSTLFLRFWWNWAFFLSIIQNAR